MNRINGICQEFKRVATCILVVKNPLFFCLQMLSVLIYLVAFLAHVLKDFLEMRTKNAVVRYRWCFLAFNM